jgi:hypothetical protein
MEVSKGRTEGRRSGLGVSSYVDIDDLSLVKASFGQAYAF